MTTNNINTCYSRSRVAAFDPIVMPRSMTSNRSVDAAEPIVCREFRAAPEPDWSLPKVIPYLSTSDRSVNPAEPTVSLEVAERASSNCCSEKSRLFGEAIFTPN